MSKKKGKTKVSILNYLVGKDKAKLIRYCKRKCRFYQAEAAFDLGWSKGAAQFHLKNFVKFGLLQLIPTSYKTYYEYNPTRLLSSLK